MVIYFAYWFEFNLQDLETSTFANFKFREIIALSQIGNYYVGETTLFLRNFNFFQHSYFVYESITKTFSFFFTRFGSREITYCCKKDVFISASQFPSYEKIRAFASLRQDDNFLLNLSSLTQNIFILLRIFISRNRSVKYYFPCHYLEQKMGNIDHINRFFLLPSPKLNLICFLKENSKMRIHPFCQVFC